MVINVIINTESKNIIGYNQNTEIVINTSHENISRLMAEADNPTNKKNQHVIWAHFFQ